MPIDQTHFRQDLTKERMLPPGDLILTRTAIEQLKIADQAALKPENVLHFLASQSIRYNEITNRPEIKSLAADIPEYIHDDATMSNATPLLSLEERESMTSYAQEKLQNPVFLSSQSGIDDLTREIQDFIRQAQQDHPEVHTPNQATPLDPLEGMLTDNLVKETEEEKTKWQELFAAAKDPELVSTILGMRYAQQVMKKIGKLTEAYKFQTDHMDKIRASLELKNAHGPLSQADMLKINLDFGRAQGDMSTVSQALTRALNDYDRITRSTQDNNTKIDSTLKVMVANLKS